MIEQHVDPKTPISRYMSFASFLSLVKNEKLFFTALSAFSDRHEGSGTESDEFRSSGVIETLEFSSANMRARTLMLLNEDDPTVAPELQDEELQKLRAKHDEVIKEARSLNTPFGKKIIDSDNQYRKIMFSVRNWLDVSCWHMNFGESLAMWKIYGGSTEAVCLNSTIGALNSAINQESQDQKYVSVVKYIDYQDHKFDKNDPLAPAIHKQKPFDYEKEVRAIVWNKSQNIFDARAARGRLVDMDLSILVSSIRLSPAAQPWFKELVESSIKNILHVNVEQSTLDRDPIL